jgi:hypothetical protein
MPSVADLIFVALLGVLLFTPLSVRLLGDAGIGWHVRTGQQILADHAIPRVDPFSSTMAGEKWFAWEWLYDVVVGLIEVKLGLNGVVWLTAVVVAAVFAWMFRLLISCEGNLLTTLGLVLLAISASMIHFLARPHVVSWLFTLAWFWILDSSERDCFGLQSAARSRGLWGLPLLTIAWVNVHGGFLGGFVLLGIFLSAAVWVWFQAKGERIETHLLKIAAAKRARELVWISLLCGAASLVNPYGWLLHAHIYSYLSNRFLMDHIDEFQSPNFHGLAQKCFLVLLLLAVSVVAVRGRELRLSAILASLFALYAGLYATRNIPVSSILLVMVTGPLLNVPRRMRRFSERMTAVEREQRGHAWPIVAILATLLIAANGGRIGTVQGMDARFSPQRMPVQAVNYVVDHLNGPILSPDYWGGYLIYRMYPSVRVVVDDRHDFYGEQFFRSYLKMMHVEPGWQEFLSTHETSSVLLPRNAPLADALFRTQGWKTTYSDDVAIVFVRDAANP